jgi:hypothetical protein
MERAMGELDIYASIGYSTIEQFLCIYCSIFQQFTRNDYQGSSATLNRRFLKLAQSGINQQRWKGGASYVWLFVRRPSEQLAQCYARRVSRCVDRFALRHINRHRRNYVYNLRIERHPTCRYTWAIGCCAGACHNRPFISASQNSHEGFGKSEGGRNSHISNTCI